MTTKPDQKIIDLITNGGRDRPFTSLEFFPPRTEDGVKVCHARLQWTMELNSSAPIVLSGSVLWTWTVLILRTNIYLAILCSLFQETIWSSVDPLSQVRLLLKWSLYPQNLHSRMDRMRDNTKPLFTDVTWGAGGSTADVSLKLALYAHENGHVCKCSHDVITIKYLWPF